MSSTLATVEYLYSLEKFGIKLGLRNIRALLGSCGNPHLKFPAVHVAGTNGKGSVSSMIASVLTAAGYKVGLFTSPHLVRFNERIRINGKEISDADIVRYARFLKPKIDSLNATFFEATTAIAFAYFLDQDVDIAIIETGLGGRLDATNVLRPEVSVITSIGKDHTEFLGRTIAKIAFEKGGIIKRGVTCIVEEEKKRTVSVLQEIARRRGSTLIRALRVSQVQDLVEFPGYMICSVRIAREVFQGLRVGLAGRHQLQNARTALAAIIELRRKKFTIPDYAVYDGFSRVSELSGLRGRFEILIDDLMVIADVAHNPDGIIMLVRMMKAIRFRRLLLVFGVMRDKDYKRMVGTISTLRPHVLAVEAFTERSLSAKIIAALFMENRCQAESCPSVPDGVRRALESQRRGDVVLITGSHYVVGEALKWLPVLKREKRS